jgi:hypothetical protein
MMLLWSERIGDRPAPSPSIKVRLWIFWIHGAQDTAVLLAGHGGEEERCPVLVSLVLTPLLAGLGGEGEGSGSSWLMNLLSRSSLLARGQPWRRSVASCLAPAYRGGTESGCNVGDLACCVLLRALPAGCYGDASSSSPCAKHMAPMIGGMIFGRKGGPTSTSMMEAFSGASCWSSALLHPQVVRPRWCGGGQRCRYIVVAGPTSELSSDLGGDAWRSPAICGGDARVLDCVLSFSGRVFLVKLEALNSNFRSFVRVMPKGFFVKCTRHMWI